MAVERKILIVEDNALIRNTLVMIFRRHGYRAEGIHDGTEAIRRVSHFRPHLMLCDVNLPGADGIEVALQCRRTLPGCQVLLLSGDSGTAEKLQAAGARGHEFEIIPKPVDPVELLAKVAACMPVAATA